jgi:hypothetical protein
MKIGSDECIKALYNYETKNYGEYMAVQLLLEKKATNVNGTLLNCIMDDFQFNTVINIAKNIVIKLGIEL